MTKTKHQKRVCPRQVQQAVENVISEVNINKNLQQLSDIFSEKFTELSQKIVELENTIKKNEKSPKVKVVEASTQTDNTLYSFADALKKGLTKTPQKPSQNESDKRKENLNKVEKKNQVNETNNVDTTQQRGVNKKAHVIKASASERKAENSKARAPKYDLPRTVIVHDSVMSGIEEDRLGLSYGIEIKSSRAYRIEQIEKALDSATANEPQPEAILIHCGINNLQEKDATTAAKSMLASVQNIKKKHPRSKIVLSKIAPTRDPNLEVKRNLFNALITAELFDSKLITTVSHDNLITNKNYMGDTIHPNRRGTSVLAGNIGRALRDLFWQRPRRSKRVYPHHPRRGQHHTLDYTGFKDSQDIWSSPYVLFNY